MRIISGKYKGKILFAPKKLPVRPTTDMQKEALFNILVNRYQLPEITVLDLFSGTGNISFEFASRGTKDITSVDMHYACVKYISQISRELDFNIDTIKSDVFRFLTKTTKKYHIIFADPPYSIGQEEFERIPSVVFEKNLLKEKGILIIEHATQTDLSHLSYFREARKYGSSSFSFFENK